MNYPAELKYSKSHEWVKMEGEVAVIGISDFAQDALGDLVFINLPQEGDAVTAGESTARLSQSSWGRSCSLPRRRRRIRAKFFAMVSTHPMGFPWGR